jgi:periplasmic nitrate reductase NapE
MANSHIAPAATEEQRRRRRSELLVFAVLAVFVWPVVAVSVVGGWGLAVWLVQQVNGPPGPPHR